MPSTIYLIRHGETDYNVQGIMQGWLDIPLNTHGHEQARLTAESLRSIHLDAIYSSDLRRAHETAQHLAAAKKMEIRLTPQLRERNMGKFNGWRWADPSNLELHRLWTEFEVARDKDDLDWAKHEGETLRQVSDRLHTFLTDLHTNHAGESVAVVTHGGTINRFFEYLQIKKTVEGFRAIGNGAVHILQKQNEIYILKEN